MVNGRMVRSPRRRRGIIVRGFLRSNGRGRPRVRVAPSRRRIRR